MFFYQQRSERWKYFYRGLGRRYLAGIASWSGTVNEIVNLHDGIRSMGSAISCIVVDERHCLDRVESIGGLAYLRENVE